LTVTILLPSPGEWLDMSVAMRHSFAADPPALERR
jgi:hypothetical protein